MVFSIFQRSWPIWASWREGTRAWGMLVGGPVPVGGLRVLDQFARDPLALGRCFLGAHDANGLLDRVGDEALLVPVADEALVFLAHEVGLARRE